MQGPRIRHGRPSSHHGALIYRKRLDRKQNDHPLKGEWTGYRECHLADDWLLVYRVRGDDIIFDRTGTHTDLFEA